MFATGELGNTGRPRETALHSLVLLKAQCHCPPLALLRLPRPPCPAAGQAQPTLRPLHTLFPGGHMVSSLSPTPLSPWKLLMTPSSSSSVSPSTSSSEPFHPACSSLSPRALPTLQRAPLKFTGRFVVQAAGSRWLGVLPSFTWAKTHVTSSRCLNPCSSVSSFKRMVPNSGFS